MWSDHICPSEKACKARGWPAPGLGTEWPEAHARPLGLPEGKELLQEAGSPPHPEGLGERRAFS